MRYEEEKAVKEILKRSRAIRKKREEKVLRLFSFLSVALVGTLTALIASFTEDGSQAAGQTVMGSFLMPEHAGGYILVAVIAFTAGSILATLALRYRNRNRD